MAPRLLPHPSFDDLKAFGLGVLDHASADAVSIHLEGCAECRRSAEAVTGDDLLDRLRAAHGSAPTARSSHSTVPSLAEGWRTETPSGPAPAPGPEQIPDLPPELVGHSLYDVVRELDRGGMGVVYLARNKLLDRLEVLKVVNRELLGRPGLSQRFLQEIQSAARLSHANVVTAYSAVQEGGLLAFAMEYVEGEDLGKRVRREGPLSVAAACRHARQAALGLQHAHERGMVHRDIKPQNLILSRKDGKDVVKILDFGLAKARREKSGDMGMTGAGQLLGTPDYIAPEQILDAAGADIRADIYSLGCTLYFLLAGCPPFRGGSLGEILQAHQKSQATPLDRVRQEVPAGLAAAVARMMEKDPARRFQTPGEVAEGLAPFIEDETMPATKPPKRRRWLVAAVLLLAGLGAMWAGGVFKVKTRAGVMVVEVNEPGADVYVDGEKVTVTWGKDGKKGEISVRPGTRQVQVRKAGFTAHGESVAMEDDGREIVVARLEKPEAPPAGIKVLPDTPKASPLPERPVKEYWGRQMLENPGCEVPLLNGQIPGWSPVRGKWTAKLSSSAYANDGTHYFWATTSRHGELRQDVDLRRIAHLIDAGKVRAEYSGHIRTYYKLGTCQVVVEYLDADGGKAIACFDSGRQQSPDGWKRVTDGRILPKGTRWARVCLISFFLGGRMNHGYHDNQSLVLKLAD